MGTTSHSSYGATLLVNCISPSNTPGAFLQLQFASVSLTSMANSTLWTNFSNQVFIDNGVHTGVTWPCPGQLTASFPNGYPLFSFAQQPPDTLLFRVIGEGGGGVGDNPRLGSVTVEIYNQLERIGYPLVLSASTTSFTVREYMTQAAGSANVLSFNWFATNATANSACGATAHCSEAGSSSCTMTVGAFFCVATVTFGQAFSVAPKVLLTNTIVSGISNGITSVTTIPIFSASQ